jgi:hypothetical protein
MDFGGGNWIEEKEGGLGGGWGVVGIWLFVVIEFGKN